MYKYHAKEINNLIGCQLVSICDSHVTVRKGNNEYILEIIDDYGGCCGYNEITTNLLISETELNRNPVITNAIIEQNEWDSDMEGKLTFFGESKPLATIDTLSSSGSGYQYGAYVIIRCNLLGISDEISSW